MYLCDFCKLKIKRNLCIIQNFPKSVIFDTNFWLHTPRQNVSNPSVNTATGTGKRKSELFLSATSVDDNGTFSCFAQNKAGKAKAEFTLHVVVPMPPKPPQVRHKL